MLRIGDINKVKEQLIPYQKDKQKEIYAMVFRIPRPGRVEQRVLSRAKRSMPGLPLPLVQQTDRTMVRQKSARVGYHRNRLHARAAPRIQFSA